MEEAVSGRARREEGAAHDNICLKSQEVSTTLETAFNERSHKKALVEYGQASAAAAITA